MAYRYQSGEIKHTELEWSAVKNVISSQEAGGGGRCLVISIAPVLPNGPLPLMVMRAISLAITATYSIRDAPRRIGLN
jgi:hypothetical protein